MYKTSPWDDHPRDGQRDYDLLCLSWGAGAAHADDLVALLPQERRVRCRNEYVNAWTAGIGCWPHIPECARYRPTAAQTHDHAQDLVR